MVRTMETAAIQVKINKIRKSVNCWKVCNDGTYRIKHKSIRDRTWKLWLPSIAQSIDKWHWSWKDLVKRKIAAHTAKAQNKSHLRPNTNPTFQTVLRAPPMYKGNTMTRWAPNKLLTSCR
jgi:hypothetical protein